jgi:hypothetical protein
MKKKPKNKKAGGGLVVRIPEDMVEALKKDAENEYRTIEQQVLWTLKRGLEWSPVTTVTSNLWTTPPNVGAPSHNDPTWTNTTPTRNWDGSPTRNWDGSPRLTCSEEAKA